MTLDPAVTNPDHHRMVFENERVRVLESAPGSPASEHTRIGPQTP